MDFFYPQPRILTDQALCPPGSWVSCSAVKKSHHPRQILTALTHINRTFVKYLSSKKNTLSCNVLRWCRLPVKVVFSWALTNSMMLLYAYRLSLNPRTLGVISWGQYLPWHVIHINRLQSYHTCFVNLYILNRFAVHLLQSNLSIWQERGPGNPHAAFLSTMQVF